MFYEIQNTFKIFTANYGIGNPFLKLIKQVTPSKKNPHTHLLRKIGTPSAQSHSLRK